MKLEGELRIGEREDCFNRVIGICRECTYDLPNNRTCPNYFPVIVHTIDRVVGRLPYSEESE